VPVNLSAARRDPALSYIPMCAGFARSKKANEMSRLLRVQGPSDPPSGVSGGSERLNCCYLQFAFSGIHEARATDGEPEPLRKIMPESRSLLIVVRSLPADKPAENARDCESFVLSERWNPDKTARGFLFFCAGGAFRIEAWKTVECSVIARRQACRECA
jgi:hypothetical protein